MAKKMLIDASHIEEMRMAIMDGPRLDGFEIENLSKKQIKGSIFLAKVIRVEPSLQAAFVEYGGNRQGFLAFNEIHPDYYQIPVADRAPETASDATTEASVDMSELAQDEDDVSTPSLSAEEIPDMTEDEESEDSVRASADEDEFDEESLKKHRTRPNYKIQEVIKRRQILLIQVVKEERGNKGAAVSTYLSLPGRYCVLMPNAGTSKGGISRKITDQQDRKRLRTILNSLDLLPGMSLIVRTAGSKKNKTEIKKDFEYLLRLWMQIRTTTLESMAPSCVYEEGNLIKRALRDTYTKDVDHVWIEGEEAYKTAKEFMKTLSPTHAKKIQLYKEKPLSLFQKYHVDHMVDEIFQPHVNLPSGGSIVFGQTEALVAVDVNSGKSTKERNLDETALKTNLEAAREVARQLRLRDLSGLVVVDFIDMNDKSHIQQVEKAFKDAMSSDRARVQIGKISQFGLLELSRQRLRPSLIENHTRPCEHCHGVGRLRSVDSMALFVLRQIETACIENPESSISVRVPKDVDAYILNKKRAILSYLEDHYKTEISVYRDASLSTMDHTVEVISKHKLLTHPITTDDLAKSRDRKPHQTADLEPSAKRKEPAKKHQDSKKKKVPSSNVSNESKGENIEVGEDVPSVAPATASSDGQDIKTDRPKRKRKRSRGNKKNHEKKDFEQAVERESSVGDGPVPHKETSSHIAPDSDVVSSPALSEARGEPQKKRRSRRSSAKKTENGELSNGVPSSQVTVQQDTPATIPANDAATHAPSAQKRKKGLWERLFDS